MQQFPLSTDGKMCTKQHCHNRVLFQKATCGKFKMTIGRLFGVLVLMMFGLVLWSSPRLVVRRPSVLSLSHLEFVPVNETSDHDNHQTQQQQQQQQQKQQRLASLDDRLSTKKSPEADLFLLLKRHPNNESSANVGSATAPVVKENEIVSGKPAQQNPEPGLPPLQSIHHEPSGPLPLQSGQRKQEPSILSPSVGLMRRPVIAGGTTYNSSLAGENGEKQHLFFLKVHKAASTTVMNIIYRFSMERDLNIMLPKAYNILSEFNKNWRKNAVPRPPGKPFFDVLCNHLVFDEHPVKQSIYPDSIYVGIVREPMAQAVSAFYYYRHVFIVGYLAKIPGADPLTTYLQDPWKWDVRPNHSFTHNRMSFDFGMNPEVMENGTAVAQYIDYLTSTFHLVMVSERFDESMVLLKRLMGWSLKDILYVKNNVFNLNVDSDKSANVTNSTAQAIAQPLKMPDPPPQRHNFTELERETHRLFNAADYALYERFNALFQARVDAEGSNFATEVAAFFSMRERVEQFCLNVKDPQRNKLVLEANSWSPKVIISRNDCELMMKGELDLIVVQQKKQLARYMPLPSTSTLKTTAPVTVGI